VLLGASTQTVANNVVATGLDVVAAGEGPALAGKRVGLLAHAASVTRDGRHAIDVLRAAQARVVRLFTPEHGLRGRAAAGEKVASGTDPESGIAVVSLYGEQGAPQPADLAGLDVLVIDVQDAGVRFYTYLATVSLTLAAAGRAGLRCVVLDRPNPLGGVRVEGPPADGSVPRSLLSRLPGPLVFGLSAGEMTRLMCAAMQPAPPLDVVKVANWRRDTTWQATGLRWVAPSPNLRSAGAAMAYPGTCLLEALNVSEGRGSEDPFAIVGAPWLDAEALARELRIDGYTLTPLRFTPQASAAAPAPKFAGQECRGVRVAADAAGSGSPYRLGVELLSFLRRRHRRELEFRDGGAALDRLVGTKALRERLERGLDPAAIVAADAADIAAFRSARAPYLLY
jgi:uncharacterized protein YbbC (DUF1343 family)